MKKLIRQFMGVGGRLIDDSIRYHKSMDNMFDYARDFGNGEIF